MSSSQHPKENLSYSGCLDIGIPGLKQVLYPHISTRKRLAWLSLLLACIGAVIFQLSDRISHYLSEPTQIHVIKKENDSLLFPSVSICLSMESTWNLMLFVGSYLYANESYGTNQWCPNVTSFFEAYKTDIHGPLIDMKQFLKLVAMEKSGITVYVEQSYIEDSFSTPTAVPIKVEETAVPWTNCITASIVDPITIRGETTVSFNIPVFHILPILGEFWDCLDGQSIPNTFEFSFAINQFHLPLPHGYDVYDFTKVFTGQRAVYRLTSRQLFQVHTTKQPCEENWLTSYSAYRTCMKNQFDLMNVSCNIPFTNMSNTRPCDTLFSFVKSIIDVLRFLFNNSTYKEDCNQMQTRLCQEMLFTAEHKLTVPHDLNHSLEIKFVIQDKFFESIHEEFTYLLPALISDIGGSLGIFLGISVLAIVEILEAAFMKLTFKFKKCCNNK